MSSHLRGAHRTALGIVLIVFAAAVCAQDSGVAEPLVAQLVDGEKRIHDWEFKAAVLMTLTISIGLLGAVIILLQKINSTKWSSIAVAVIGFTVSSLTVIMNTAFPVDYRMLKKSAIEGRELINQARPLLAILKAESNPREQKELIREITRLLSGLSGIEKRMMVASASPGLISAAYAGESRPAWSASTGTETSIAHQFVGTAANASLSVAREQSLVDAVDKAARRMAATNGPPVGQQLDSYLTSARAYVKNSAKVVNTYIEYDQGARAYRHFTLLELNKAYMTAPVAQTVDPSLPIRVIERTTLMDFHRAVLGGEFQNKVAVYVEDIRARKSFRIIVFEIGPQSESWEDSSVLTANQVRSGSSRILFDGKVQTSNGLLKFSYGNRKYRVQFVAKEGVGFDRFKFEVYRG